MAQVGDILTAQFEDAPFDVCTDKGTYDAISLCPEDSCTKRKHYVVSVASLLMPRGIYIITSCNWTAEEIEEQFKPCERGWREGPSYIHVCILFSFVFISRFCAQSHTPRTTLPIRRQNWTNCLHSCASESSAVYLTSIFVYCITHTVAPFLTSWM